MQSWLQVFRPWLPRRTYSVALLAKCNRCYGPVELCFPQNIEKYKHLALLAKCSRCYGPVELCFPQIIEKIQTFGAACKMQSMLQVVMPMLPIRTYSKDKHLALLAKFSRCYGPVGLCVPQELIAKYKHLALRCLQNAIVVTGLCVPQELIAKDKHLAWRCLHKAIVVTGLCFPRKPTPKTNN